MIEPFVYTVQGDKLFADPLRVRRLFLEATDGRGWQYIADLDRARTELDKLTGDDPKIVAQRAVLEVAKVKIEGALAEATITAFDMPPFDPTTGEGVTEYDALDILRQFMEYAEGKD